MNLDQSTTKSIERRPLNATPNREAFTIRLVDDDQKMCHFWVGLSKSGVRTPKELLDRSTVSAILISAAKDGLAEEGPLILSNSDLSPPRYIYLLPKPDLKRTQGWLGDLLSAIKSWSPKTMGFYFASEIIDLPEAEFLLEKVFREFLKYIPTRDIYILAGDHNSNALLNLVLRMKDKFWKDGVELFVFHQ